MKVDSELSLECMLQTASHNILILGVDERD